MRVSAKLHLVLLGLFVALSKGGMGYAQNRHQLIIDSLVKTLGKEKKDTNKIKLLASIAYNYFLIDPIKGVDYANQGLSMNSSIGWKNGYIKLYNAMGANYWAKFEYSKALNYYRKALAIAEAENNIAEIAKNLSGIAITHQALFNFSRSKEYLEKAYQQYKSIGDINGMLGCQGNLANLYQILREPLKVLDHYKQGLLLTLKTNNKRNIAFYKRKVGVAYADLENYQLALEFEMDALAQFKKINSNEDITECLSDIAYSLQKMKKFSEAVLNYKNAIEISKTINERATIGRESSYFQSLGNLYLEIYESIKTDSNRDNRLSTSLKAYLHKADSCFKESIRLANSLGEIRQISVSFRDLSFTQSIMGNYKNALNSFKKYILYRDSIINLEKENTIIRDDLDYEYGKQKDSLKQNNVIQTKLFQQKQELTKLQLKQQSLYAVVFIILLSLITSFLIFRYRLQKLQLNNELIKEKSENEMREIAYRNQMNDLTLTALRAQMNPHFIFNCLNSIKLYSEQYNFESTMIYLTKFSKLIRYLLDNSQNDCISLSAEIETLYLYLELETMRFKEKLKYTIHIDELLETDFIEIPPLLIQPYVENAIWHGLMNKESGGLLDIEISQSKDSNLLLISIIDNGIGRKKSMEATQNKGWKSFGSKITGERISLLNHKNEASVKIIDLYTSDYEPCGTHVIIQIPIK